MFGEYFIRQMSTTSAAAGLTGIDDEYDDDSDNYISDDHGKPRASEYSRRSKLKSITSRSQTPSRSPVAKKMNQDKGRRRHALNNLARDAL